MKNIIKCLLLFSLNLILIENVHSQKLQLGNQIFELHNVKGEIIQFQGSKVLKIERDLIALPFDSTRLEATVDDRHYAKLIGIDDFENGTIEVKIYSQIQNPSPYKPAPAPPS